MLKYLETARKALPIKRSQTNQQTSDIPKVPKNHTPTAGRSYKALQAIEDLYACIPILGF